MNSKQRNTITINRGRNNNDVDAPSNNNRLSWPQFYQRNRSNLHHTSANNNKKSEDDPNRHREPSGKFERVLCPDEARVMQKANQIVMYVLFFYVGGGGGGVIIFFARKKLQFQTN